MSVGDNLNIIEMKIKLLFQGWEAIKERTAAERVNGFSVLRLSGGPRRAEWLQVRPSANNKVIKVKLNLHKICVFRRYDSCNDFTRHLLLATNRHQLVFLRVVEDALWSLCGGVKK